MRRIHNCVNVVESFKNDLDGFLAKIPDQPTIPGLSRAANSNSLTDHFFTCQINDFELYITIVPS